MKKSIIKTLAIMMAACVTGGASAQYFMSGGIGYQVLSEEEHTVEVTGKSNCTPYSGNINIPATVTYNGTTYDVVALGEEAFYEASLSSITIPSSVKQIKYGCFVFATGPSTITVPASVEVIESIAFAANNLTTLNVDENNPNYISMDGMLFSKDTTTLVECLRSKSGAVTLPQKTRYLDELAFAYCQDITEVTLPEGLVSIGYWAFVANKKLNNVVIPSSVTYIAPGPFVNCPGLNNLSIAEGNTHYYMDGMMILSADGDSLLSYHKSADSVYLPNTLRYINGFSGNYSVKYVHVPDGVTTIGREAFNGSTLVSIDLPSHLHSIENSAFYYCTSLTRVGMPATLDTIGSSCFHTCLNLTSVDIPDGLRTITEGAFFMCNALSNITWGNAVEVIGPWAFGDCSFTELTLPPTLRVVKWGAFIGDYRGKLKRLTFSAPVDTIEVEAFYMQPLRTLRLQNTVPPATTDDGYGSDGCMYGTAVDSIIIPCGSMSAWLADSYWRQFIGKYHEDCNGIEDVRHDDINISAQGNLITIRGAQGESVCIYDALGRQVHHIANSTEEETFKAPSASVYIIKVGNNPAKKIATL